MVSKKISLNIDDELWQKFRVKTTQEKTTATSAIVEFIKEYLKGKRGATSDDKK